MISFHFIFIFHFSFSWHFTVFSCDVIAQTCILFHLISFVSLCYFSVIGFSIFHHHSHPITHTHTHPGQTRARGGSRIDRQTLHASMPSCSILRTVHKYTNIEVYCPSSGIVSWTWTLDTGKPMSMKRVAVTEQRRDEYWVDADTSTPFFFSSLLLFFYVLHTLCLCDRLCIVYHARESPDVWVHDLTSSRAAASAWSESQSIPLFESSSV